MGSPFSQGVGGGSAGTGFNSGSSFGFGQGSESIGSFRALLEDSPSASVSMQNGNNGNSNGSSSDSSESNMNLAGSDNSNMGGGVPSSSSSMYGYSSMPLGYPLSPMLSMPNPMFMPMMPSAMMGQHYPSMQSSSSSPLSAMGHMAAMGSHLSQPGTGLPPSSSNN